MNSEDRKYKWTNLFYSTDRACWNMGFDFIKDGEPTGEKVILHCKKEIFNDFIEFDNDFEFDIIKYTNENIKDHKLVDINKPFTFYLARVDLDDKDYKDPRGKKISGVLVAEDEITIKEYCKQNNIVYSEWKNKGHYGEIVNAK